MRILPALKRRGTPATSAPTRASGSRFRPRLLTLVVFVVTAAIIALANLSYDEIGFGNVPYRSYGWPLVWHRIFLDGWRFVQTPRVIGWYYSLPRLAANLVVWFSLLAALAGGCEWLLRRYRPRPRWSLRGLLAFVALVAVLCGWYAHARNRAAIQDPLISLEGDRMPRVFVDRWGPKWLDVLGMDHVRRRIVLANNCFLDSHEPATEQTFLELARVPGLRHLINFRGDELTPTTAKVLGGMRRLETLEIDLKRLTPDLPVALSDLSELRSLLIGWSYPKMVMESGPADDNDARLADECLAAIGNMTRLEELRLWHLPLHGRGLACLAGLKRLKSLDVDFWTGEWKGSRLEEPVAEDALRAIATLTQLEWLGLNEMRIRNESLACLVGLTNLKTLRLDLPVTDERPTLSHLPPLPRLDALGVRQSAIGDDDLRRLAALPRLKRLDLEISTSHGQSFTPAGLAALGSLDSLEELRLGCDIRSPEMIRALGAIRRLKMLHLNRPMYGTDDVDPNGLTLDDGRVLHVDDLDGFRRALAALRQSKPGLVIDTEWMSLFWNDEDSGRRLYYKIDAFPERPAAWLPGGDLVWMTPKELADFEQAGGRASFEEATAPDPNNKGTGGGIF